MTLTSVATVAAALSLLIGSIFIVIGSVGLLKFNDPMTRLHAPTKVGTLGIGMLLLASILASIAKGDPSMHELLIMAFLFVTAPVSANFIAKVCIHSRACKTPPSPPRDGTWSTLDTPDGDGTPAPQGR
ncbi:monovalent cation/H(+) antiporter subunit G [Actibacterium sp. XHP0104]|uniref:monovalent cation/H(+) antiporter subunit G n=1 Tax=Actibacterium sp. XHP0104 TaxID=2984335 RepID=UPI0021E7F66B|nr:monovalent cation/H(+) antiporter subunit G [Actibacterium sp. XHP0104]MCV2882154.1 monovalent cation/H(+) antiporter subunit G [Actibacterium sp. XHP0104]